MKKLYYVFFIAAFFIGGCKMKEADKLQSFSAEAFAYDMGDGWDVNATVRVKGFAQKEVKNTYTFNLIYTVDLITPKGEKKEKLYSGVQNQETKEKTADLALESQFELDSTYEPGKYKLVFNISDGISNQKITVDKELELGSE